MFVTDKQRKAARREKHKNDPYYLYDEGDDDDIDEIPIVKLEDEDLESPGASRGRGGGFH